MKLDKHRFERQKIGYQKWKDAGYKGSWEWCTGMGKTFGAILSMKKLLEDKSDLSVIVVVPTDPLREQWREEVEKFKVAKHFDIDTVHMHVRSSKSCDLLILDELHKYIGEEAQVFPTIFEKIQYKHILGLSASIGNTQIRRDLVDLHCPIIDTITTEEAVENKWLSPYIQYNFGIQLTPQERLEYSKLDSQFYKWFAPFNYNFDLVKKCLQYNGKQKKLFHPSAIRHAQSLRWDHERLFINAMNTMRVMKKRKQFLYEVPSKLDVAKQIIDLFPDDKIITFGQTTDAADKLAAMDDRIQAYHSNIETKLFSENGHYLGEKVGKDKYQVGDETFSWKQIKDEYGKVERVGQSKLRERIIKDFKESSNGVLSTATALDVGFDDENIRIGIVISGTSKDRQDTQRIGRVLRMKDGKFALIFQLYVMDSQDEKWLDKRQTANNVIDIVNINQIKHDTNL